MKIRKPNHFDQYVWYLLKPMENNHSDEIILKYVHRYNGYYIYDMYMHETLLLFRCDIVMRTRDRDKVV